MENLLDILGLYKDHYPLWRNKSLKEIYLHIYPSLLFGQCRLHRDDDGIAYGFRNWAFLNEEAEKKFLDYRPRRHCFQTIGISSTSVMMRKHKPPPYDKNLCIAILVPKTKLTFQEKLREQCL